MTKRFQENNNWILSTVQFPYIYLILELHERKVTNFLQRTTERFQVTFTIYNLSYLKYKRCCIPKTVIATLPRLWNLTSVHATTLKHCIPSLKGITSSKLYDQYYHSLINHAREIYLISSLVSINSEDEERAFCFLKRVASMAPNHHPDNVISNGFIRLQVHNEYVSATSYKDKIENVKRVTKTKKIIGPTSKTLVTFKFIEKRPFCYQLHLERLADFLRIEGSWRETEEGIDFEDVTDVLFKNKNKHNFRYSN